MIVLLNDISHPKHVHIAPSLGRSDHLIISTGTQYPSERGFYRFSTNHFCPVTEDWREALKDFANRGKTFKKFQGRHPIFFMDNSLDEIVNTPSLSE